MQEVFLDYAWYTNRLGLLHDNSQCGFRSYRSFFGQLDNRLGGFPFLGNFAVLTVKHFRIYDLVYDQCALI